MFLNLRQAWQVILRLRAFQDTCTQTLIRNAVKIITLFGGTNPAFHGYRTRTFILGRGRKEQARFTPGLAKDLYDPKVKNLFDHITSQQLTDAILHC